MHWPNAELSRLRESNVPESRTRLKQKLYCFCAEAVDDENLLWKVMEKWEKGFQLSAFSYQLSALSYQLSAIGYRLWVMGYQKKFRTCAHVLLRLLSHNAKLVC